MVEVWEIERKHMAHEGGGNRAGLPAEQINSVAIGDGKEAPSDISGVARGPVMQVRGAYASMACHALNGLVGAVDNHGGTLKANKEYTQSFPGYKDFKEDTAKAGKKNKKIDHRGGKEFLALTKGKTEAGGKTKNAANGIINEDPTEIKVVKANIKTLPFLYPGIEGG